MSISIPPPHSLPPRLPPLENGDRLSRVEFERRYNAMPRLKKAELIQGVVHLPSPVRTDSHGTPHADLMGWFAVYRAATPGVSVADNSTVRINFDSVVQPDIFLMIERARGGQAHLDEDGYIAGSEPVAEVSATSASIDLNTKLQVYCRSGVREYVVWRTLDRQLDWFVLREGEFQLRAPDADGLLRSEVFPGLWLDAVALLSGDLATVLRRLQEGLATPEHAAFVARLQATSA